MAVQRRLLRASASGVVPSAGPDAPRWVKTVRTEGLTWQRARAAVMGWDAPNMISNCRSQTTNRRTNNARNEAMCTGEGPRERGCD